MSVLTVLSAALALLFTGVMAGTFFGYSSSVMIALDAIKPEQAVAAMNSINVKIQNPAFLSAFMLAPVAGLVTGGLLFRSGHRTAAALFLAAAVVYFFGALVPTMTVNVPMNDTLTDTRLPLDPVAAARVWSDFSSRWTMWNTIRTVGASISLLLAGVGSYAWGSSVRSWPL